MGFKFTFLCDLLSSLEDNRILKATTQARNRDPDVQVVTQWFARYGKKLRDSDTDQRALLSCMFPEKRTDRTYWLQDTNLARVIGRCLLLGSSRREELERWRITGGADLGKCVENVMRQAENHIISGQEVTVEEVDTALNKIASRCRFSAPRVRKQRSAVDVEETLSSLYRRLSGRDAKWLSRMILKSHLSAVLPQELVLKSFHFLLPHLLLFQDSFEAAVNSLSSKPICHFPPRPEPGLAKDLGLIALHHLTPDIGIKIGRPEYYKARSIKHCCNMAGQRRMSVERKYDGEYCQIHIDLSKHSNSIQIFSKNGKDSTADRSGVHQVVKDSLRIGKQGCKFSRHCILEGELVVWSDKLQKIEQFHKLRKLLSRSGTFIGTENDSPPQPHEHLMMVFFDILLLDDDVCLRKPHRERRLLLQDTIQVVPGISDIAEQRVIDFSRSDGQSKLEALFSLGIAERWEGFVLKSCDDPYFPILVDPRDRYFGRWIKLKKDYIPGLGDTIDLALIGAAYNSRDACSLGLVSKVSWTHFFVGCLENKDAVFQSNAKPKFRVVDVIDHHCMSELNMQTLNRFGKYGARRPDFGHGYEIDYGRPSISQMDVVFKTPFVVEILGSGFEKPPGARYYTLRFPRILKIHSDRSLDDAASFQELQLLAEAAVSVPPDLVEEEAEWVNRLKSAISMPGYTLDRSQSLSTVSCHTPPRRSDVVRVRAEEDSSIGPCHSGPFGTALGVTTGIPIYVDRLTSSNSSDGPPEPEGSVLASNGYMSSRGSARKRKASLSASEQRNDAYLSQNERIYTASERNCSTLPHTSLSMKADIARGETTTNDRPVIPDNMQETASELIASPLLTIPIYISLESHFKGHLGQFTSLANIARTMDDFLHMLKSANRRSKIGKPHPGDTSQELSLGIVFAEDSRTPLGTTLLALSERVSQSFYGLSPNYPARGRIFLINAKFLQLDVSFEHDKFCLRKTWETISREYFYACVAWDLDICPGYTVEEVSGTPMDDDVGRQDCLSTLLRRNRESKLRISFDRKELLVLGELSWIEPSLYVEAP